MLRLALALLPFVATAALAGQPRSPLRERIDGPVLATLESVIDGDTLLVTAHPWPQHAVSVLVRLRGIDAPELRSKCPAIRVEAERARATMLAYFTEDTGGRLELSNISGDKYFGRVVADVTLENGASPAALLLAAGLARPYDGGHKPAVSCP